MSTIKKMFGLGAAVVMAVMAFGASSAFAADTATCAFTGLAGGLNPPIPAANKFPIGQNQTGTYNFAGPGTCVAIEGDTADAPTNSGVYNVNITSAGSYKKDCASGEAAASTREKTLTSSGLRPPRHRSTPATRSRSPVVQAHCRSPAADATAFEPHRRRLRPDHSCGGQLRHRGCLGLHGGRRVQRGRELDRTKESVRQP